MPGSPFAFLVDGGLRSAHHGGAPGVVVRVRLASYRSLPLSCLRDVAISIDGVAHDPAEMVLRLDGHAYRLSDLRDRTDLWWYVLDHGEIFIPLAEPLRPGEHTIEGSLTTIKPFATGGRSTRTDHSVRRMELNADE